MVENAKLVPPLPVPVAPPTRNVEALDVPFGSVTVRMAVPAPAMSADGIVAVNLFAEEKEVVNGLPLNCTTEEFVKLVPLMVSATSPPPAAAEPGLSEAMVGVKGPGVKGVGVGKGAAGGMVTELRLTKS